MDTKSYQLVRETWAQVLPIADQAAELFYGRLFELSPEIEGLFAGSDMAAQRGKLLTALNLTVQNVDNTDALVPVLQDLGRKHVDYGVKDEHYGTVGAALIWTLEKGLGEAFTDDARSAWTAVYGLVATTMQDAANERIAAAA